MKKIVTIGGGSGQPELLRALKKYPYRLSALVSMMDNGGSSGVLREEVGVLPPGDLRRSIVALADASVESDWHSLWEERDAQGHAFGNVALVEKTQELGDMQLAADWFLQQMDSEHEAICSTLEPTDLAADFSDGTHVIGEHEITVPTASTRQIDAQIERIELVPVVEAAPRAFQAIKSADVIVLSMGDVFTSVIPVLLLEGITDTIAERQQIAKIPVIVVCNRTTKLGETHGFSMKQLVDTFAFYLDPGTVTHAIVDSYAVPVPGSTERFSEAAIDPAIAVTRIDLSDEQNLAVVSGAKAAKAIHDILGTL
jgi:uncharacterized cofD-like protein